MESKGTVYYYDCHTEDIIHCWVGSDNYIEFYTKSGKYAFIKYVEEDPKSDMTWTHHTFVKCGVKTTMSALSYMYTEEVEHTYTPVDIETIVWKESKYAN